MCNEEVKVVDSYLISMSTIPYLLVKVNWQVLEQLNSTIIDNDLNHLSKLIREEHNEILIEKRRSVLLCFVSVKYIVRLIGTS